MDLTVFVTLFKDDGGREKIVSEVCLCVSFSDLIPPILPYDLINSLMMIASYCSTLVRIFIILFAFLILVRFTLLSGLLHSSWINLKGKGESEGALQNYDGVSLPVWLTDKKISSALGYIFTDIWLRV